MNPKEKWWNKKHDKYASEDWIDKPTIFAQFAIKYFPKKGSLLELGAGHGQDGRFFAENGYDVTSSDFSENANNYNSNKISSEFKNKINVVRLDISKKLPFGSNIFDIVYAHLSIHYFDDKTTDFVFSEIYRVLKDKGIIALLVNSIEDPEYGTGVKLDTDFYELSPGDVKHFFSLEYMELKSKKFDRLILDNKGTTYKDNVKGVFNLIRFIGTKSSN